MDAEGKFWFSLWTVLAALAAGVRITDRALDYSLEKEAIKAGLHQELLPTPSGSLCKYEKAWVK